MKSRKMLVAGKMLLTGVVITGMLLVNSLATFAMNTASSTSQVVYKITEDAEYRLTIYVPEHTTAYDGEQSIQDGTVTYILHVGDEKVFLLEVEDGYEIQAIYYYTGWNEDQMEKIDITDQLVGDTITITMIAANAYLEIITVPIDTQGEDGGEDPPEGLDDPSENVGSDDGSEGNGDSEDGQGTEGESTTSHISTWNLVQTSDDNLLGQYVVAMLASIVLIGVLFIHIDKQRK